MGSPNIFYKFLTIHGTERRSLKAAGFRIGLNCKILNLMKAGLFGEQII